MVALGFLLNPWLLKSLFSPDGILESSTKLLISTFDSLTVAFGLGWLIVASSQGVDSLFLAQRTHRFALRCCLSVGTVIVLVACAEGICGLINYCAHASLGSYEEEYHSIINTHDPVLGYRLIPGGIARVHIKEHGRTVMRATYMLDTFGRRKTPPPASGPLKGTVLFFGDSFTFGEWVDDNETMPFAISQLARQYQVYNYGVPGYGPQHLLAKLESGELASELGKPAAPVTLVYTFIDSHVKRAIGSMHYYAAWMADCPLYVFNADKTGVVRRGSFRTGRPRHSFLYGLVGRSQVFRLIHFDWPRRISRRDINLVCSMIEASRDRFKLLFGSDRFYVLFYPGSDLVQKMAPRLASRGISVLDYSHLVNWDDKKYHLPADDHPNPQTHRLIAEQIARDLKLSESGLDRP